jgi:oligoribonuclease NrnB/cAMP/cGMP phosphodiesterase (DHH superfamily)
MHVVYCSAQLDGIAAAAIVLRAARLQGKDTKFGGTLTHELTQQQFSAMNALSGDLIFILDFLPDSFALIEPALKSVTVRNRIAYWASRQPHDAALAEQLKKCVHTLELVPPDAQRCTAEITQSRFLPKDTVCRDLARLAHDSAFEKHRDPGAIQLADLLASGYDPKELVDTLTRGVFWSERFDQLRKDYLARKTDALQDVLDHLTIKHIGKHRFGFTLAPAFLQAADAAKHVIDSHTGVDVAVILFRNGRVSFRKRSGCVIDLGALAQLFGGNGTADAAGATLAQFPSVSRETYAPAVLLMDRRLKEFTLGADENLK